MAQPACAAADKAAADVDLYLNTSLADDVPSVTSVGIDDAVYGPVTDGDDM